MATVRRFSPDDVAACVELYVRVYTEPPFEEHWPLEAAHAHFDQALGTPGFRGFVAVDGPQVIGVLTGVLRPTMGGPIFHLEDIFVERAQRRAGIADEMMTALRALLAEEGAHGITLFTQSQAPAVGFYQRQGFAQGGLVRFMVWRAGAPDADEAPEETEKDDA